MRFAWAVLLFVVGAATGLASVAVHEIWWGLALAVAATAVALVGVGRGWLTRLPFALGWLATVFWLARKRPEGDYVVSSDVQGYLLLGFGLCVLLFAVATLPRPRARRRGTPVSDAEPS